MPIHKLIAQLRTEHNLSQEQLAEVLNVTQNAISLWETGKRSPRLAQLVGIADYFGVSIDYLVGRDFQPTEILTMEIDSTDDNESMPETPQELEQFIRRVVDKAIADRNQ